MGREAPPHWGLVVERCLMFCMIRLNTFCVGCNLITVPHPHLPTDETLVDPRSLPRSDAYQQPLLPAARSTKRLEELQITLLSYQLLFRW